MCEILSKFRAEFILHCINIALISVILTPIASACPAVWNMSGTAKSYNDIGETGEMDFEWERNHNWYYARVIGPLDITYAQVSGNLQQSI